MNHLKTYLITAVCSLFVFAACKSSTEPEPAAPVASEPDMYFTIDSVKHILPRVASYYKIVNSAGMKSLYYTFNDTTVQIDHKLYNLKTGSYTNMQNYWDSTEVVCYVSTNGGNVPYRFTQGTYKIIKENGKFISIISPGSDFYDTYRWKKGEMRLEWPN